MAEPDIKLGEEESYRGTHRRVPADCDNSGPAKGVLETAVEVDQRGDNLVAPQFAFRRGHQAHEAVFTLRQLVEKALEWNMGLFLMDGDVRKAYDYTKHSYLVQGLQAKRVENILIAAIIREIRRSRTVVSVDRVTR